MSRRRASSPSFGSRPRSRTSPDGAGGCGAVDAQGSPLATSVPRETLLSGLGLSTFSGLAFAPNGNLYAAEVLTGRIGEYDLDGDLVRMILAPAEALPPISTGNPQGIAIDADGTLYYADLDLVGAFPERRTRSERESAANSFRRKRRPAASGDHPRGASLSRRSRPPGRRPAERRLEHLRRVPRAQLLERRRDHDHREQRRRVDREVGLPHRRDRHRITEHRTDHHPGEGRVPVAFIQSWDANVYAIRVRDGSEVWRFATEDRDGVSFPNTASVHVGDVDARPGCSWARADLLRPRGRDGAEILALRRRHRLCGPGRLRLRRRAKRDRVVRAPGRRQDRLRDGRGRPQGRQGRLLRSRRAGRETTLVLRSRKWRDLSSGPARRHPPLRRLPLGGGARPARRVLRDATWLRPSPLSQRMWQRLVVARVRRHAGLPLLRVLELRHRYRPDTLKPPPPMPPTTRRSSPSTSMAVRCGTGGRARWTTPTSPSARCRISSPRPSARPSARSSASATRTGLTTCSTATA